MSKEAECGDSTFDTLTLEDANALKMVLGEYGILILVAIKRGATTRENIPLISGVPMICVTGRIPVVLSLGLMTEEIELKLTPRGSRFLDLIGY